MKVEPQTVVSGREFTITAIVTNKGAKELGTMSWRDQIRCNGTLHFLPNIKIMRIRVWKSEKAMNSTLRLKHPMKRKLKTLTFEIYLDVDDVLLEK